MKPNPTIQLLGTVELQYNKDGNKIYSKFEPNLSFENKTPSALGHVTNNQNLHQITNDAKNVFEEWTTMIEITNIKTKTLSLIQYPDSTIQEAIIELYIEEEE